MGIAFGKPAHTGTFASFAKVPIPKNNVTKKVAVNRLPIQKPQINLSAQPSDIVTPVNVNRLDRWLQGYAHEYKCFIIGGFAAGFSIPYQGKRQFRMSKNLKSANENLSMLKGKIQIEIDLGRIAGPFNATPFPSLQVSPLGLVPKKEEGKFRLIHHLSFPENDSINDGISQAECSVSYQNIDDAVRVLKQFGKGCFMCKTDIEDAFRIVPICPTDHELLGMYFDNQYYYDKCLPMGMSYSCKLFERVSSAIQWIAENKLQVSGCAHILDDFFFAAPSHGKAISDLNNFLKCMADIGIPIKSSKTVHPTQTLSFVGIELDSLAMEKRLPFEKIAKIRHMLGLVKHRKCLPLKELQSVIGLLSFACSVIAPGRPFLRRLIDLTVGLKKPHYKRRLNKEARADLEAWSVFIEHFNGKSLFLSDIWRDSVQLHLFTDASNVGFGGYYGNKWFADSWPSEFESYHINIKELFPIVLAVEFWGKDFSNQCIMFHCDNMTVVHVINKQTSKDKIMMALIRRLVVKCMQFNIMFQAQHVEGVRNIFADQLSRFRFK